MSTSESEYETTDSSGTKEDSVHVNEEEDNDKPGESPRPLSTPPSSTLKRRYSSRASSAESTRIDKYKGNKRYLASHYHDDYRVLFNEAVDSAAARFETNEWRLEDSQVGMATWSRKEKASFFAALNRLGKDDIAGIASVIGTKSISEVRHYLLVLHEALLTDPRQTTKVTLHDVPAAMEISAECDAQLDFAGESLAWLQERFEARQEAKRFGKYWLITPEIADKVENALKGSRHPSVSSSSPPLHSSEEQAAKSLENAADPQQILQDIPEANLLNVSKLLYLASTIFMNGSDHPSSWGPHWSTLSSSIAREPSLYRTALMDFHTLVLSLIKRLVQTCIIQATSRIRSQGWRPVRNPHLTVKTDDALAAIDLLHLPRNGRERWRRAARRCGLRVVFDGIKTKKERKREIGWDEAEDILGAYLKSSEDVATDGETPRLSSAPEDENFKARATRSGTPLPPKASMLSTPSDDEEEANTDYEGNISDASSSRMTEASISSSDSVGSSRSTPNTGPQTLEEFDYEASKQEELRLWKILGVSSPFKKFVSLEIEEDEHERETVVLDKWSRGNDWRDWTDYRAPWETFRVPVPFSAFEANRKVKLSRPFPLSEQYIDSSSEEELEGGRLRKKRKITPVDIPIRSSQAYAAFIERKYGAEQEIRSEAPDDGDDEDDSQFPVPTIEDEDAEEEEADLGSDSNSSLGERRSESTSSLEEEVFQDVD